MPQELTPTAIWTWRRWHLWAAAAGLLIRIAYCLTVSKESSFAGWDGKEYFAYATNGSQYSLSELRELAKELGVSHRVGFTGFVDEPAAALRSLDIVVHASTEPEPFGLAIAQGMACGRAVIATKRAAAPQKLSTPRLTQCASAWRCDAID